MLDPLFEQQIVRRPGTHFEGLFEDSEQSVKPIATASRKAPLPERATRIA